MCLVRLNITIVIVVIIPMVSCTESEKINGTVKTCWIEVSQESHQLETRCNQCSQCPMGTYTVEICTKSKDTVCKECPVGTFSVSENSTSCLRCTDCAYNGMTNLTECSPTEDATCGCPDETYLKNGRCVPCSKCPPGKQVSSACGNGNDTECKTCRLGSFSDQQNSKPYCEACDVCYRNRIEIQSCSPTTNTICGECKEGHYKEENTANCAKCSYCYPEFPGYTYPVEECYGIMQDLNYTCMPVVVPPYVGVIGDELDVSSVSPILKKLSFASSEQTTVIIGANFFGTDATHTNVYISIIIAVVIVIAFVLLVTVIVVLYRCRMGNKILKSGTKLFPGNVLTMCFRKSKTSISNNNLLGRQSSMESGDELDETNRSNMLSSSNGPNILMNISEEESDESNKPNLCSVGKESNLCKIEKLDDSNNGNLRHVSEERNVLTEELELESDRTFDSINSDDSGFASIKEGELPIGSMNKLDSDKQGVVETSDELRTKDVVHKHPCGDANTTCEASMISVIDGKAANSAVYCLQN